MTSLTQATPIHDRIIVLVVTVAAALAATAIVGSNKLLLAASVLPVAGAALIFMLHYPLALTWSLIVTAPLNDYIGLPLGSLVVRPYTLLTPVLILSLLLCYVSKGHARARAVIRTLRIPLALLLTFLFVKIISNLSVGDFPGGMTRLFNFKMVLFAIFLCSLTVVSAAFAVGEGRTRVFIRIWLWTTLLSVAYAMIQLVISNTSSLEIVHHRDVVPFGRPFAFFREPDVFASYLGASFLMSFALFMDPLQKVASRGFLLTLLVSTGIGLIVLFVRAAWLGTLAGLIIYLVYALRTQRLELVGRIALRGLIAILVATSSLVVLSPSAADKLFERINSVSEPEGESASQYRLAELSAMAKHIVPDDFSTEHIPAFMLGHGDFSWSFWAPLLLKDAYDQDADKNKGRASVLIHPGFMMPLAILHDNGIIGAGILALFFLSLAVYFFRYVQWTRKAREESVFVALFLPICCILICFVFSYDPITPFFWVLIGMYLSNLARHRIAYQWHRGGLT